MAFSDNNRWLEYDRINTRCFPNKKTETVQLFLRFSETSMRLMTRLLIFRIQLRRPKDNYSNCRRDILVGVGDGVGGNHFPFFFYITP